MQLCASARLSAAVVLRPRAVQYRRVTKMSADAPLKKYKLDASSEGCTGLFYRRRNADGTFASDGDPQWPRNGFVFQGREVVKGWVQVEGKPDKWLPISGHGHTYLWPQE